MVLMLSLNYIPATIASATPAVNPQTSVCPIVILPFSSFNALDAVSKAKKRVATLGTEKKRRDDNPRYSPNTPAQATLAHIQLCMVGSPHLAELQPVHTHGCWGSANSH